MLARAARAFPTSSLLSVTLPSLRVTGARMGARCYASSGPCLCPKCVGTSADAIKGSFHHKDIDDLLEGNKQWVAKVNEKDPGFFKRLAKGQSPSHFWIGCADSRVPANEIVGLGPGEVFVHRNVANMVVNTDLNMLSCLQFAVQHLKVKHIIVCGHYDCGGVRAALKSQDLGTMENWVRNVRDVVRLHQDELFAIKDEEKRVERLVELNVMEQVVNVFKTGIVQQRRRDSYKEGGVAFPRVHGLVYAPGEGILKKLKVDIKQVLRDNRHIYDMYLEPEKKL